MRPDAIDPLQYYRDYEQRAFKRMIDHVTQGVGVPEHTIAKGAMSSALSSTITGEAYAEMMEALHTHMAKAMPKMILVDQMPPIQYRFPTSKKMRIRKKWAKRPENYRPVESPLMLKGGNILICTRDMKREIESRFHAKEKKAAPPRGAIC